MDWEDKFTSIVKETERNLAKAKEKLSGKTENSPLTSSQDNYKSYAKNTLKPMKGNSSSNKGKYLFDYLDSGKFDTSSGSMSASSIQVLHMQEQIDSQERTIQKMKHLVRSLDSERDYYKEQISLLKGEVDLLTSTMRNQTSSLTSELKMSNVKREVMQEVNKVKLMVQSFDKNSARRTPLTSPRVDPEFWNIKENLTNSLEQVRFELAQMKGRIDRMEGQLVVDSYKRTEPSYRSFHDASEPYRSKPLYTPTSKVIPSASQSDLQQMRTAISSLTSKINNIERTSQLDRAFDTESRRPHEMAPGISSHYTRLSAPPSYNLFLDDELHSLSDLSDLSSNVGDGNDSDDDDDLLDLNVEDYKPSYLITNSSVRKESKGKKGKVEFDLSDLDLSDVEEVDAAEFEADCLDLDDKFQIS